MKRPSSTSALLLYLLLSSRATLAAPFKVVLDPGHGGGDQGTHFTSGKLHVTEKAATLMIAKQVAEELKAFRISATLTRTTDEDLRLSQRTAMANKMKADLFLSIHMNSAPTPDDAESENAQGFETYILNNTTDDSSRRLAQLENAVLGPKDARNSKEATDNPDVALILRDLRLDANLAESKRLACAIQDSLVTGVTGYHKTVRDRGVRQALFYVLLGAEMPSALLEAGFLSNARDRALILSANGRKAMARSIAYAIDQFRRLKGTPRAESALSRCKVH